MSRMDLLILPMSVLAGFMRQHLVWFSKSGLLSFGVKKAVFSAVGSVRWHNFSLSTMSLKMGKCWSLELSKHVWNLKKGKSTIFDQMGHHQTSSSRQKRKMKQHSEPRGKANDYERSFKEHSL